MVRAVLAATAIAFAVAGTAGCGVPTARFPSDVQAALAGRDMRRLETAQLVLYYPDGRHDLAVRMATRIEACATELRSRARVDNRHSREKMVIVVPEAPFNNAYVLPPALGLEDVAVIPAGNSLDFATQFGLPPDPGHIGCHEITHYVQVKQIAGMWGVMRTVLGDLLTPQIGFDAWFLEGLATYYEAKLQPGAGRPRWPVFTGMFHAAYAGGTVGESDLSEQKRLAPVGHHYLVGSMFVQYLAETYGDGPLWRVVEEQAHSGSVLFGVNGKFAAVYGKGLGELVDDFRRWVAERYPVRTRPPGERVVTSFGNDARWAWGPNGEVAVIDDDTDVPARLQVWDADGGELARIGIVDVLPPRRQVIGGPLFVTGMSFAADGTLWFTSLDLGNTYQTTRLYRWRREGGLREVTSGLGPGGAIAPDGQTYYHMVVDGDRWSLAAHPLAGGPGRTVWDAAPGQYALRVQPSPDGKRLAASVWDGHQFSIWVLDAATGATISKHAGTDARYDAAWTPDGRLLFLDVKDGRFQVSLDGKLVTDAPYGALEPRVRGSSLRFLARDGWHYTLDEVALPPPPVPEPAPETVAAAPAPAPDPLPTVPSEARSAESRDNPPALPIVSDTAYSRFDRLFRPSLHTFSLLTPAEGTLQLGLGLSGGDRLDLIRWSVAGYLEPDTRKLSGVGGVLFNDLAPWTIAVLGQRLEYTAHLTDDTTTPATTTDVDRETRTAIASLSRTWRGTYSLGVGGVYNYDQDERRTARLYGPALGLAYSAIESTLYTGPRRGLALQLDGVYYPRTSGAITDARAQLDVFAPLPFSRRHVLHATVRGRAIEDTAEPWLQLGGWADPGTLWSEPYDDLRTEPYETDGVPASVRFAEPLRGFEDSAEFARRAAIVDLSWTYPLIIDRGITNLFFFPATFFSQLDLELFATGVIKEPHAVDADYRYAAGTALTAHFALFRVPLVLRYQIALRHTLPFDSYDHLQLVGLGAGI